jgi:hypothetical protein
VERDRSIVEKAVLFVSKPMHNDGEISNENLSTNHHPSSSRFVDSDGVFMSEAINVGGTSDKKYYHGGIDSIINTMKDVMKHLRFPYVIGTVDRQYHHHQLVQTTKQSRHQLSI